MWHTTLLLSMHNTMQLLTNATQSQTISLSGIPGAGAPVTARQRTQW